MASFKPEQKEYISTTIAPAISQQSDQITAIMAQGKDTQDEIVVLIRNHNQELHDNSNRVSLLVDNANASAAKIKDSTDKIAEAEKQVGALTAEI